VFTVPIGIDGPVADDTWFWSARIDGEPAETSYLASVAAWTKLAFPLTATTSTELSPT